MRHEKNFNRLFKSGSCPAKGHAGSRKIAKAHVMFVFFFMTCWPMFMNLWNKREHSLMIVYDCNLQKIGKWTVGTRISRKGRERVNGSSPPVPCQVSTLMATFLW